ncbi:MAG: hypothetical protein AAGC57_16130 [Pseudomonadota bacterium]
MTLFSAGLLLALIGQGLELSGAVMIGVVMAIGTVFALPPYALIGVPLLWWTLRPIDQGGVKAIVWRSALTALFANLGTLPLTLVWMLLIGQPLRTAAENAFSYMAMGLLFAPVLGALIGLLYRLSARIQSAAQPGETP